MIAAFAGMDLKLMITELDVDVLPAVGEYRGADITYNVELQDKLNPYSNGLPDEVQQALTERYARLFRVLMNHRDVISRVSFWVCRTQTPGSTSGRCVGGPVTHCCSTVSIDPSLHLTP
jgi:hypothetical protein